MDLLWEYISGPWPWYICGPLITFVMFLLLYEGKNLGVSSNFATLCAIGGAGKFADFFRFDWKAYRWNLFVVLGMIIGGVIASQFLTPDKSIDLNENTVRLLERFGFNNAGSGYLPVELFSLEAMLTWKGGIMLAGGGLLIGFGARYAGGCTSGHAISGLSNLQLPSLIAVIGFFAGGLFMVHVILPLLLN